MENKNTSVTGKKQLLAVLRMEQLAAEEHMTGNSTQLHGFSVSIDRKGTVIFTLPNGGRILDSGRELFFFGNDVAVRQIAVRYAQKKWGKILHVEGNKIVRLERNLEKDQGRKPQNMER